MSDDRDLDKPVALGQERRCGQVVRLTSGKLMRVDGPRGELIGMRTAVSLVEMRDTVTFGPTIPLADFDPKMAERLSASVEPNPEPLTITDVDHKTGTVTVRGAKR